MSAEASMGAGKDAVVSQGRKKNIRGTGLGVRKTALLCGCWSIRA